MAEKLLQHKHCQICGRAVPLGEDYCGDECKKKMEDVVKRKRFWMYIFYALMAAFIVLLMFTSF